MLVWILAAPAPATALPQAVVDAFQEGNRAYQEGDFAGAAAAYTRILEGGRTAPGLEFNLGNAYLKEGDLGRAVLHYRRALKLDPTYENALANLDYARSLTQDVKPETDPEVSWSWIAHLRLGPEAAASLLVASLIAFFGVAAFRLFLLRDKLWTMLLQGTLVGIALLLGTALLFEWSQSRKEDEGVLLAPEVAVRAGPGEGQTVAFRLHSGTEVHLLRHASGWREVKVADGLQGWIPEAAVEPI